MTYRQATERLLMAGIENARVDAAILLEEYCGATSATLLADPDRDYDCPALSSAIERRSKREPLQYILGKWYFFDLTLEVDSNCLCPRSDTEIMVDAVIRELPPNARMLELCTGSGCIPIAVCVNRPDVTSVSTDLFEPTLSVARRNAESNRVADRISFIRSDIFARELDLEPESFDAIVSNPPYIPSTVVPTLAPEVMHEPSAALDGGEDGLDFYREIFGYYTVYLKKDGFIALEIGYDQGDSITALATSLGMSCKIIKDLGGNDRCAICRAL